MIARSVCVMRVLMSGLPLLHEMTEVRVAQGLGMTPNAWSIYGR